MANITFRTQLLGSVAEFCGEAGLRILFKSIELVELIIILAKYKEEGVSLCPKVYITSNIGHLISMIPDGEKVRIGKSSANIEGINEAVKKCAPLARRDWNIYISEASDHIEFGLFKGSSNPISVDIDEIILNESGDLKTVKIFQAAEDCVEIQSSSKKILHVFLNHKKEDTPPPMEHLSSLVGAITKKVSGNDREATTQLMKKTLISSFRESHGCLISVTTMGRPPAVLASDGITLETPIDFAKLVSDLKSGTITSDWLQSKIALLNGMIQTDGIILFDDKGRLLGYNYFIKTTKKVKILGGARRRAFASLKENLGRGLSGVFIQSQDGWTEFEGIKHGS